MTGAPLASSIARIARLRPATGRPTEQSTGLTGAALRAAVAAYDAGRRAALDDFARPKKLADGSLGYPVCPPREDMCLAAAIATTLQAPMRDVPDARIDERLRAGETPEDVNTRLWSELTTWLHDRGLKIIVHHKIPVARDRWIGVVKVPGVFQDHCLVLNRSEVLWDPIWHATEDGRLNGRKLRQFTVQDVRLGLSFVPTI